VVGLLAVTGLIVALAVSSSSAADKNPVVVMETSLGTIKIELWEDKSPGTVKNFLAYVDGKHYDGMIFHRVIGDFMIQGGGFASDLKEKPTNDPIKNEASPTVKNEKYTIAMARTGEPDSATAQFFINTKDNDFLNKGSPKARDKAGYCVFGKVIEGTEVVDKIAAVETENKGEPFTDIPVKEVTIKSVRRANK
jgi:cyclophilin family peptidyl-prolyl cis-trans isomerase